LYVYCISPCTDKKGWYLAGGSIGYSEQKSDYDGSTSDTKSRTVVISPAIGKVVKDNLVVGISLSYYNSKTENNSSSTIDQKGKSYGGGVFVRQYVPSLTGYISLVRAMPIFSRPASMKHSLIIMAPEQNTKPMAGTVAWA
jgi:hypothetical protein